MKKAKSINEIDAQFDRMTAELNAIIENPWAVICCQIRDKYIKNIRKYHRRKFGEVWKNEDITAMYNYKVPPRIYAK